MDDKKIRFICLIAFVLIIVISILLFCFSPKIGARVLLGIIAGFIISLIIAGAIHIIEDWFF